MKTRDIILSIIGGSPVIIILTGFFWNSTNSLLTTSFLSIFLVVSLLYFGDLANKTLDMVRG